MIPELYKINMQSKWICHYCTNIYKMQQDTSKVIDILIKIFEVLLLEIHL
jgi:hypothetical protein